MNNKRKSSQPKSEVTRDSPIGAKTGGNLPIELIKEQYAQYYEMVRHHTSLSWNIPSFAVACAVLFFGLDSSKMQNWSIRPVFPALYFLVICIFFFVMLIHHKRNDLYAGKFDRALSEIERKWGIETKEIVHHLPSEAQKRMPGKFQGQ